jgi:hypothetical protein
MYYRLASEDHSAAVANLDYTPLVANNSIIINPSDVPEKLIPITIRNDNIFEEEENFTLRLSTSDPSVSIDNSPNPVNVFIVDDDSKIYENLQ